MENKVSVYGCTDDPSIVKIGFKYEDGRIEWDAIMHIHDKVVQDYLREGGILYPCNASESALSQKHGDQP